MKAPTKKRDLLVVNLETDEVVERIDVTGRSESSVERVERGLLRKTDTERFYVHDTEFGEPGGDAS